LNGKNLSQQLRNETLIAGSLVFMVMDFAVEKFTANRKKDEAENS